MVRSVLYICMHITVVQCQVKTDTPLNHFTDSYETPCIYYDEWHGSGHCFSIGLASIFPGNELQTLIPCMFLRFPVHSPQCQSGELCKSN